MAQVVQKVVIHNENGSGREFKPNDGEAMKVKIKKVEVDEKKMSSEKTELWRTRVNNSIGIADSLLEATKAYVIIDYRNRLNALQGVGDIIKGVYKFVPGPPNPLVQQLGVLEGKLKKIGENMSESFTEMKAYISEVKFCLKIMSPTLILIKLMRDCITYPGPATVQNFKNAYNKHSPLKLAYLCMSFLEQKSTNPLRMVMDTEKIKTKATFEKWERKYRQIFLQFMFLEAFSIGLQGWKSLHNVDVMMNRGAEIDKMIQHWKREYGTGEEYWTDVKKWLEDYIPKNPDVYNQQKAKVIAAKLETYLTNDAHHVVVMNQSQWQFDYMYICQNEPSQIIGVWNKGKCCAFIYRSRRGNQFADIEYENTKREVTNCRDRKLQITARKTFQTIPKNQLIDGKMVRGDGLVCLIDRGQNAHIEVANCVKAAKYPKGTGFWEPVTLDVRLLLTLREQRFKTLLVCFP